MKPEPHTQFQAKDTAREPKQYVGPQGTALILELRRLRQAFERDHWSETRSPQPHRSPQSRVRFPVDPARLRNARRPHKKGRMGRAIDACLEQFGLVAPPLAPLAPEPPRAAPPAKTATRQRRRKPVHSVNPVTMDLAKPGPDIGSFKPSDVIAMTGAAAPTAPDTRLTRWIAQLRGGLAFVLAPDGPALPGEALSTATGRTLQHELKAGLRVLIVAGVLVGGWATLMPLAGAVVVPGNLVVQSNVKTIQHPTGGVVAEIAVRNGMRVNAGDLLLRLDATQAQASLQVVSKQLDEFRARSARLMAERDGLARPDVPDELAARLSDTGLKALLAAEATLFQARANARHSQRELLRSRVTQLNEEIAGLDAQVAAKAKQIDLIAGELTGVQDLYDKRLVPLARLTALQRESARIEGERGQLVSAIAETKAKIGEAQLQIVRIDQDFRTDVVKELGETRGKEAELVERAVAARDLLDRIELRAPTSGIIHQLAVHTIGGVIRGGDAIMEVVPDSDQLQIEAHLAPADIDQVRLGQKAFTRFPAFNQRVTPEVAGLVSYVSADISRDQQSNASYFTVRVTLPDDERRRLAGLQLVSGMPAEIFLQTGSRTMLSYLFKPITDQLQRAFVER